MRILLLSACLFFFRFLPAQTAFNADSVERIFHTLPDSTRIREANNLMKFYMDVNFKKSIYYAKEAIALVDRVQNKSDAAYTYVSWAIAQYNYGQYDSCVYYNLLALDIYQALADTAKMAVVYNNLSSASNALGDYASGAYNAYKAFLIYSEKQTWRKAAISCLNLSSTYYEIGDYDTSLTWARRGYQYYMIADEPEELGYAAQMFTDVFIARNNIDSALYYIEHVAELLKSHPNEYLETVNQVQRGDVLALQGDFHGAIALYNECIRFYEEMDMPDAVLYTHLSAAKAYAGMKNWRQAEQSANRALTRSLEIRNKPMIVKSSTFLSEIHTAQQNLTSATEHYRLTAIYRDSIMNQSVRGNIDGRFLDVKLERETQARLAAMVNLKDSNTMISHQWKLLTAITVMLILSVVFAHNVRRAGRERQRMNAELVESNRKLSELNREINGLVNTIVHDLKSPLNSIQGILSLIEMNGDGNGTTGELIAMANKSIANGHEIIRQLLELRALEENPGKVNYTEIDAAEFTQELHDSFVATARQKNITLSATVNPYVFTSDKALVRRIMDNLLSNAIKFSSPGGTVNIRSTYSEGRAIFRIEDEGPGFTQDDLDKIYGRFQKLSARPTAGEQSNGLGLATVQALIKHLDASIDLDTNPGSGSVFTVAIPAKE